MKPRLIYQTQDYPSFAIPWVRPLIEPHFDLVLYDPEASYDPQRDTALVTYASRVTNGWYQQLTRAGHRLLVDHLWDSDVAIRPRRSGRELELRCPDFMWYLASIEFEYHGYRTYQPCRRREHSFLMLMNNPRWHRDALVAMLHNVLDRAVYSYNARNITLSNDKDPTVDVPWQRYMNPDWYDSTAFSVVAESYMRNTIDGGEMITEVSEKIFKPLAYRHPFVTAGSAYTLQYLRGRGFESYSTWFDESYDTVRDDRLRLATVCREIDRAVHRWDRGEIGWDAETIRRTQHNHDLMFDRTVVNSGWQRDIIEPIQEFLCER